MRMRRRQRFQCSERRLAAKRWTKVTVNDLRVQTTDVVGTKQSLLGLFQLFQPLGQEETFCPRQLRLDVADVVFERVEFDVNFDVGSCSGRGHCVFVFNVI
uniref:Uncharacterized protein n=1 Tax=Cacopsylla melanoneura TaxID=428564 RepID=A0A8D8LMD4_9HEMI